MLKFLTFLIQSIGKMTVKMVLEMTRVLRALAAKFDPIACGKKVHSKTMTIITMSKTIVIARVELAKTEFLVQLFGPLSRFKAGIFLIFSS